MLAVAVGVTVACATTAIKEGDVARRHNEKKRLVPVVLFAATLCLKKKRLVPVEFRYAVTICSVVRSQCAGDELIQLDAKPIQLLSYHKGQTLQCSFILA